MARQAALLLLTVHSHEIPLHAVNNDFYRQALELDLRGKREYTDVILSAMGGVDKRRFSQFKLLLQLSDEALELADRHNLDEFRLRPILQLPPEAQAEMIQHIVQFNLSGRQVKEICERGLEDESEITIDTTSPHIRRLVKSMQKMTEQYETDFLRDLLSQEQSHEMAGARIESTISFLMRIKNQLSQ